MAKARATTKPSTAPVRDDRWRIPDVLWERIEPLLPPRPPHPLGGHNPRVSDRKAMDAIFFVLRTGCQWNALNATGICSSSSAHRRFQEWTAAGVFVTLWARGLEEYDALKGLDWRWLAMDGAMTKAPLGGERTGKNPTDRGKLGAKRSLLTEANGVPVGSAVEGANRHDKKVAEATLESIPVDRPEPTEEEPQGMCLDKGYDYDDTRELVEEFGFTARRTCGRAARRPRR
jgi:putative transposase